MMANELSIPPQGEDPAGHNHVKNCITTLRETRKALILSRVFIS